MNYKTKILSIIAVFAMLAVCFVPIGDESEAASGDGGTYSYTITYNASAMSSGTAAISVSDMTAISHSNTAVLESMNKGSWTWDLTTGIGPFNSFYAAFDINNGNRFVSILNPEDLSKKIDGTTLGSGYNIMWVLPTVYWKVADGNITLTNDSTAGGTAYAHTIDGHVYNYIAIGVYEATSDNNSSPTKLTSETGKLPLVSKTRAQFRSLADAYTMDSSLGSNAYSMLWNFYQWELYKYCSLAVMEDFNSQNIVGWGHTYGSTYAFNTGATDSLGPYAGKVSTDVATGGDSSVKLFLENSWGGVSEFVDGAVFVGNTGVYIDTSSVPTDSTTAGGNVTWNALTMPTSSGFPTQISTDAATWGWGVGSSYGGSATTGLADKTYPASSSTGDKVLYVGGTSDTNASGSVNYGLSFARAANDTSYSNPTMGSRLALVFDAGPAAGYTATIASNNTDYGTVDESTITDIAPGTAVTITNNGKTLIIGSAGTVTATPTTSTAQYTYGFTGWYDGIKYLQTGDTIDADVTITATFTQTLNDYTVTIARNNTNWGTVSDSSVTVPYGTSISAASNVLTIGSNTVTATAASATAQYTYAFDSWTGASGTVTADKTITANFERTVNQYTVSVTEVDPANIGSFNVMSYTADYGTSVTFTDSSILFGGVARITETHSGSDAQYTNTFAWSPNLPFTLTQNVQVTGTFTQTVNQYTVTIQSNDNSYGTVSPGSVTVDYGTAITVSGNSLTVGSQAITATPATSDAHWTYAFAGWDTASSTVTGNKTITGTFTRTLTPHTVSIASNDTTYGLVAPTTVSNVPYGTVITVSSNTMDVNGTTVTATPNAATQSQRFSFSNWTVGGTAVGSTYTVTDDVSIVGNFTVGPNVYTVTIVAGENGTVSQASIADVPYGTAISSSDNVLTVGSVQVTATPDQATDKYTYSFGSWTNGTGTVSDDMTITANFTATINEYTVTIQPNNADYGTVSPTTVLNVPYDTVIAVDGDEITIDGTTVTATPNEQTVQYVFSFGSWTLPTGSKTGTNTVITANFAATLREYTVTWVINGDSQDQTYQYGQTPSHAAPQVPGYSFGGWTPEIVSVTGDATYTATLTPITYTITWNANGGTVDPATSQGTVEDSIELPVPEREFYDFDGWFTSAEGGIQIAGPLHPTSNATYYAHWTMRTYTVTFNGSGGTPGTASSDGSEIMAVTMPGAELTGKFLKGWFTSADGGDRIGLEGSMYYPSEDITLYAQWSDTQVYDYIVNFDGKGGWDVPSALLAQNSSEGTYTFTLPMNVPENTEGNNFLGWSTSPEAVTVDVEPGQSVIVNSDEPRTLYAVWSDSQPDNPFGFIMKTVPILVGVGLLIGVVSMFITNRMSAADLAKAIAAIAVGVILLVFVLIPISGGF